MCDRGLRKLLPAGFRASEAFCSIWDTSVEKASLSLLSSSTSSICCSMRVQNVADACGVSVSVSELATVAIGQSQLQYL